MGRIVEIRTYRLKPGAADEYDRLFVEAAAPLLETAAIDVVAHGPSLGDPDGYVLIRAFDDLGQRDRSEAAFYGSEAWRAGPREQILALIDSYLDVVLELEEATIDGLRQAPR